MKWFIYKKGGYIVNEKNRKYLVDTIVVEDSDNPNSGCIIPYSNGIEIALLSKAKNEFWILFNERGIKEGISFFFE